MQVSEKRLLASIHDVAPCFESQVDRLADLIEARLGPARYAMLVVPDHWGRAPLAEARGFQARLRAWADSGVEMFVHGWFHRDTAEHKSTRIGRGAHAKRELIVHPSIGQKSAERVGLRCHVVGHWPVEFV